VKADALLLTRLYDTLNKAYVLPGYQRPFAWDKGKAIALLDAILEDANASAKLTSLGTLLFCDVPNCNANHPFGNNSATTNAPNTMWEVVDGQQRLTVFAIIGHALKERHQALTAAGLLYSPPMEFEMLYVTSRTKKGMNVPVLIRDGDNFDTGYTSDIAKMLDAYAGNQPWPAGVGPRLLETNQAIVDWVNSNLDATNFAQFASHFLTKCTVVQVEADDQDTAFTMFEPLNSTSEPLTAFEVYRSKAVRKLNAQFPKTEELLAYEKTSRDDVIKRSNTLIFTMAQAYSGVRPRIHFVPLKHYLDDYVDAAFINHFEAGAEFFRTIWIEQTATDAWFDDEAKNCIRFLKAMSHDVAVPLLLRYYLSQKSWLPDVLKIIVAFYGLWRSGFPTNNLPNIYRALLTNGSPDDMSVASTKPLKSVNELAAYFRAKLEAKIDPAAGQPVDEKWASDLPFLDYEQLKTLCRLYIFVDMGASIKSNLVPNDPWTSVDDIEHIHPAGVTPLPTGLHDLGNLTFLPVAVNRSLQDTPWNDKKEVYAALASATKTAMTTYTSGNLVPQAVQDFLNDPSSPSLAHLGGIAGNPNWTDTEISARHKLVLSNVWNTLYGKWLNP
jgi:hypothetical protein